MKKTGTKEFEKELLLTYFTLENLREAIFWINETGQITLVNQMACEMTGRTKEELLAMKIPELNASPLVQDFPKFWNWLKTEKKITFEAQHRHKTGYLYDVEIAANFIEYEGQQFTCSIVRDIRKKNLEEELLRTISESTASLTGEDYFHELTRYVTATLGVRYCIVTECANEEKTKLRTISYVDRAEPKENVEYDLNGTPCEIVMTGKDYFQHDELEKQFPREKGIISYLGVPIYSPTTKEVLGHIAAFDKAPMTNSQPYSEFSLPVPALN
jgi:PAS domain S-box-containing protein